MFEKRREDFGILYFSRFAEKLFDLCVSFVVAGGVYIGEKLEESKLFNVICSSAFHQMEREKKEVGRHHHSVSRRKWQRLSSSQETKLLSVLRGLQSRLDDALSLSFTISNTVCCWTRQVDDRQYSENLSLLFTFSQGMDEWSHLKMTLLLVTGWW